MIGTLVNVAAIVAGTALGVLLKKGISEKAQQVVLQGIGMCVLVIGIMSAIETDMPLLLVVSVSLGGFISAWCWGLNGGLTPGASAHSSASHREGGVPFAEGLVTATITFCVGAMAILGSIESGLHHNYELLFVKSALDGFFAMLLATRFGFGVALSAVPVAHLPGRDHTGRRIFSAADDRYNDDGGIGGGRRADRRDRR